MSVIFLIFRGCFTSDTKPTAQAGQLVALYIEKMKLVEKHHFLRFEAESFFNLRIL